MFCFHVSGKGLVLLTVDVCAFHLEKGRGRNNENRPIRYRQGRGYHLSRKSLVAMLLVTSLIAVFHFHATISFIADENSRLEQATITMPSRSNSSSSSSRAELFAAIQSLSNEDKRALLKELLEDDSTVFQNEPKTEEHAIEKMRGNAKHSSADLVWALESLPAEEREEIINEVNGNEYQYRLSCPNYEDTVDILKAGPKNSSRSVIIGYHVGMINNWRDIVKDQLNTLFQCGLGSVADHMYISYSNNNTAGVELRELESILDKYTFARDATILHSHHQPIEGVAINSLHEECTKRVHSSNSDTVAFYFHTKGSSHYTPDWKSTMDKMWTYSHALYWRKYMEYFTIERPYLCMKQIFDNGKFGCGVQFHAEVNGNWPPSHYAGNFWATSCRHLSFLEPLTFYPQDYKEKRHDAEMYIANHTSDYFVSLNELNETRSNLYENLVYPGYFSEYAKIWHPDWM